MKLENERLCVEIADMGAEVTRIYDKKNGLWYELQGDYYFPYHSLSEGEQTLIGI